MRRAALQKVEQACKQAEKEAERYSSLIYFYFSFAFLMKRVFKYTRMFLPYDIVDKGATFSFNETNEAMWRSD